MHLLWSTSRRSLQKRTWRACRSDLVRPGLLPLWAPACPSSSSPSDVMVRGYAAGEFPACEQDPSRGSQRIGHQAAASPCPSRSWDDHAAALFQTIEEQHCHA